MMKPMWKVTFTMLSLHLLPFYAATGQKPPSWTKVYRWRWRARLAAFCPPLGSVVIVAKIEPFWPDAPNVAPLRAA